MITRKIFFIYFHSFCFFSELLSVFFILTNWNSCIVMASFQNWCYSVLNPTAKITVVLLSSKMTRLNVNFWLVCILILHCLKKAVIFVCTPNLSTQNSWAAFFKPGVCLTFDWWVQSLSSCVSLSWPYQCSYKHTYTTCILCYNAVFSEYLHFIRRIQDGKDSLSLKSW